MEQRITEAAFKKHLRVTLLLAVLMAMLIAVSPAAYAQDDPFDSQYGAPPTAPPSEPCGDDSGSGDSGDGGGIDSSGGDSSSGSTDPNCAEYGDPETPSTSSGNAISDGSGDVLADTEEGPVVDLLPTTGGLSLGAAILGGTAILGAGVVAVRRRG